jgi:hypothetical protein
LNQIEQSFNHDIDLKDINYPAFNDFYKDTFTQPSKMIVFNNNRLQLNILTRPFIIPILRGFNYLTSEEATTLDSAWLIISGIKHQNSYSFNKGDSFSDLFKTIYPLIRKLIKNNFDDEINDAIDIVTQEYEDGDKLISEWIKKLA